MRILALIIGFFPMMSQAHSITIAPETTIAQVDADLNGDGITDRALLHQDEPHTDAILVIWKGPDMDHPSVITDQIIWSGGPGQTAELRLTEHGSLQVVSMNFAIGRNRWQQTLTIAYRDGRYMLGGYTYEWYDSLDLENSGTCDVNLFNGRGILETGQKMRKRKIRVAMRAMPITDWRGEDPKECFNQ